MTERRSALRPKMKPPKKIMVLTPSKDQATAFGTPTNVASVGKAIPSESPTSVGSSPLKSDGDRQSAFISALEVAVDEDAKFLAFVQERCRKVADNLETVKQWRASMRSSRKQVQPAAAPEVVPIEAARTFYRAHVQKHHDTPMPFDEVASSVSGSGTPNATSVTESAQQAKAAPLLAEDGGAIVPPKPLTMDARPDFATTSAYKAFYEQLCREAEAKRRQHATHAAFERAQTSPKRSIQQAFDTSAIEADSAFMAFIERRAKMTAESLALVKEWLASASNHPLRKRSQLSSAARPEESTMQRTMAIPDAEALAYVKAYRTEESPGLKILKAIGAPSEPKEPGMIKKCVNGLIPVCATTKEYKRFHELCAEKEEASKALLLRLMAPPPKKVPTSRSVTVPRVKSGAVVEVRIRLHNNGDLFRRYNNALPKGGDWNRLEFKPSSFQTWDELFRILVEKEGTAKDSAKELRGTAKELALPKFDDEHSKEMLESFAETELGVEGKEVTVLHDILARSMADDYTCRHDQDDQVVLLGCKKACEWRNGDVGLDCDLECQDGGAVWCSFEEGVIAADESGIALEDALKIEWRDDGETALSCDLEGGESGAAWGSFELGVIAADDSGMLLEDASNMTWLDCDLTEFDTSLNPDMEVCWDESGKCDLSWKKMKESRKQHTLPVPQSSSPMPLSELSTFELSPDEKRCGSGVGVWDTENNEYIEVTHNRANGGVREERKRPLRTADNIHRLIKLSSKISSQADGTSGNHGRLLSHLVRFVEALGRSQEDLDEVCRSHAAASEDKIGISRPPKELPTRQEAAVAWPPYTDFKEPPKVEVLEITPGLAKFDADAMMLVLESQPGIHTRLLATTAGKEKMLEFLHVCVQDYFQDASEPTEPKGETNEADISAVGLEEDSAPVSIADGLLENAEAEVEAEEVQEPEEQEQEDQEPEEQGQGEQGGEEFPPTATESEAINMASAEPAKEVVLPGERSCDGQSAPAESSEKIGEVEEEEAEDAQEQEEQEEEDEEDEGKEFAPTSTQSEPVNMTSEKPVEQSVLSDKEKEDAVAVPTEVSPKSSEVVPEAKPKAGTSCSCAIM